MTNLIRVINSDFSIDYMEIGTETFKDKTESCNYRVQPENVQIETRLFEQETMKGSFDDIKCLQFMLDLQFSTSLKMKHQLTCRTCKNTDHNPLARKVYLLMAAYVTFVSVLSTRDIMLLDKCYIIIHRRRSFTINSVYFFAFELAVMAG